MKYILFDKDGTLIHFHETWIPFSIKMVKNFVRAFNIEDQEESLLYDLGYRDGKVAPNSAFAAGSSDDFYNAFGKYGDVDVIEPWVRDYYQKHLADTMDDIKMIEGAEDVLKTTHALGYKNVVCTNDSRRSTKMFIERFQLKDYIHDIVCSDDTPYSKPDVRMLKPFLERNNASFNQMIMIGDNTADTLLGKEQGLVTVGVLSGTGTRESLHGAKYIIEDVNALIKDGQFVYDDEYRA